MSRNILGLMGLPGAGKTQALEHLTDRVDHQFEGFTMSSVAGDVYDEVEQTGVDQYFSDEFKKQAKQAGVLGQISIDPTDTKVDELGDWVDSVLSVDGDFFALKAVHSIREEFSEETIVVVDGVRTTSDVSALNENFNLELLYIHTPFSVRLDRLQDRGRGEEATMTPEDLINRDNQELSWGVDNILETKEVNYFYNNFESISEYQIELTPYVDDIFNLN